MRPDQPHRRGDESLRTDNHRYGDTLSSSRENSHARPEHRRTKSAFSGEEINEGFVKRLVSILDEQGKVIQDNTKFLQDISSALRDHSYNTPSAPSRLARPVSEPALRMPTMNSSERDIDGSVKENDVDAEKSNTVTKPKLAPLSSVKSSALVLKKQENAPLTPPDTPSISIADWSLMPVKSTGRNSSAKDSFAGKPVTINTTQVPPKPVTVKVQDNSSETSCDGTLVTVDGHAQTSPEDKLVTVNNHAHTSTEDKQVTTDKHSRTSPAEKPSPSDDHVMEWVVYHVGRAAKSIRYDTREVDLKIDQFLRRITALGHKLQAAGDPTTIASHQRKEDALRAQVEVTDALKQELAMFTQTLKHYRKERGHPLHVVNTMADKVIPGYSNLDTTGRYRGLYTYYQANKGITKSGDRERYNSMMLFVEACLIKPLYEDFVDLIDTWMGESQHIRDIFGISV